MSIWFQTPTIENINKAMQNTMSEVLNMRCTEIGDDYLAGTMLVNDSTKQPYGILHGGASVALAETLGSFASACCVDVTKFICVGVEINANHLRKVTDGMVTGIARPIKVGKTLHVWEIKISNDYNELTCISRLTTAVIKRKT